MDRTIRSLSQLSGDRNITIGQNVEAEPGDLLVTESQERAMAAAQRGATVWRVEPASGELDGWGDLPLALAFLGGTLDDVKKALSERPELEERPIGAAAWTPQGDVVGSTDNGKAIFATAGPDGETPEVFVGDEAKSREAEARSFAQTLIANDQVSTSGALGPGQTHTLTNSQGRRPEFRRRRFSTR
jgi:hypothetical protein